MDGGRGGVTVRQSQVDAAAFRSDISRSTQQLGLDWFLKLFYSFPPAFAVAISFHFKKVKVLLTKKKKEVKSLLTKKKRS